MTDVFDAKIERCFFCDNGGTQSEVSYWRGMSQQQARIAWRWELIAWFATALSTGLVVFLAYLAHKGCR